MRVTSTIAAIAAVTITAACGQSTSAEDRAAEDWQLEQGAAWQRFAASYESGWTAGCEAAEERASDQLDPRLPGEVEAAILPNCALTEPPGGYRDLDSEPPSDPAESGYSLGFYDGCRAMLQAVEIDEPDECTDPRTQP